MRMTDQQIEQDAMNARRKYYLDNIRKKYKALAPDATDDEVFQALYDNAVEKVPDLTVEEFGQAIDDEYGKGFTYTPPDTRTFGEKAADVGTSVAPLATSLGVNLGGAIAAEKVPLLNALGKVGPVVGKLAKSTPIPATNLILGAHAGFQIGPTMYYGKEMEKTLENAPQYNFPDLYDRFERIYAKSHPDVVVPEVTGQRKRRDNPVILNAVRNIIGGNIALTNSLASDLEKTGRHGQQQANEAIANIAINQVAPSLAPVRWTEAAGEAAAARATARATRSALLGTLAGAATKGAIGGAVYGGAFGGLERTLDRWESPPQETAEELLARKSRGLMANSWDFIKDSAGEFGAGFKESWKSGALIGGILGLGFGGFHEYQAGSLERKAVIQQQALAAKFASLERFEADMTENDIKLRFADEIAQGTAANLDDATIAAQLMGTLYPEQEILLTPLGTRATVRLAKLIASIRGNVAPTAEAVEFNMGFQNRTLPAASPGNIALPVGADINARRTQPVTHNEVLTSPLAEGPTPFVPPNTDVSKIPGLETTQQNVQSAREVNELKRGEPVTPEAIAPEQTPQGQPQLSPPLNRETLAGQPVTPSLEPNLRDLGPTAPLPRMPGQSAPTPPGALVLPKEPTLGLNTETGQIERPSSFVPPPQGAVPQAPQVVPSGVDPNAPSAAPAPSVGAEPPGLQAAAEAAAAAPVAEPKYPRIPGLQPFTAPITGEQAPPKLRPSQRPATGEGAAQTPAHATKERITAMGTPTKDNKGTVIEGAEVRIEPDSIDNRVLNLTSLKGEGQEGASSAALDKIHAVADAQGAAVDVMLRPSLAKNKIPVNKLKEWYESKGYTVVDEGNGWAHMRRQPSIKSPISQVTEARAAELGPEALDRAREAGEENADMALGNVTEGQPLVKGKKGRAAKFFESVSQQLDLFGQQAEARLNKKIADRSSDLNAGLPNFSPSDYKDLIVWSASKMFQLGLRSTKALSELVTQKFNITDVESLQQIAKDSKAFLAKRIVGNISTVKQMEALLEKGRLGVDGMGWYDNTWNWLERVFGEDADMMARFLACTSGSSATEANATAALKAYAQWKLNKPFEGYMSRAIAKNLQQAANSKVFGGAKVQSFYYALAGDVNAVVLDRFMMRALGFKDAGKKGGDTSLNDSTYKLFAAIMRDLAEQAGMTPRQFQAAIWAAEKMQTVQPLWKRGNIREMTRTGSFRPFEQLLEPRLNGKTPAEYVESKKLTLDQLENATEGVEVARLLGGYTFDPYTFGPSKKTGYVVTVSTEVFNTGELTATRLLEHFDRWADIFKIYPDMTIGLYDMTDPKKPVYITDPETGRQKETKRMSVDLNITLPFEFGEDAAIALGKENRQKAIGRVENGEYKGDILTGYNPDVDGPQFLPENFKGSTTAYRNFEEQKINTIFTKLGVNRVLVEPARNENGEVVIPNSVLDKIKKKPQDALILLSQSVANDLPSAKKLIDDGYKVADEAGINGMVVVQKNGDIFRIVNPNASNNYSMLEKIASFREPETGKVPEKVNMLKGETILSGSDIIEQYRNQGGWIEFLPPSLSNGDLFAAKKITNALLSTGGIPTAIKQLKARASSLHSSFWISPAGEIILVPFSHDQHAKASARKAGLKKVKGYVGDDGTSDAYAQAFVNKGYIRGQLFRKVLGINLSTVMTPEQKAIISELISSSSDFVGSATDDLGRIAQTYEKGKANKHGYKEEQAFLDMPTVKWMIPEKYDMAVNALKAITEDVAPGKAYENEFVLPSGERREAPGGHSLTLREAMRQGGLSVTETKVNQFLRESGVVRLSVGGGLSEGGRTNPGMEHWWNLAVESGKVPSPEQEKAIANWVEGHALGDAERLNNLDFDINGVTGTGFKKMMSTISAMRSGKVAEQSTGFSFPKFASKIIGNVAKLTQPGWDFDYGGQEIILPNGQPRHLRMLTHTKLAEKAAQMAKLINPNVYSGDAVHDYLHTSGIVRLSMDAQLGLSWSVSTGEAPMTTQQRTALTEWLQRGRKYGCNPFDLVWEIGNPLTPRYRSGRGQGDFLRALEDLSENKLFSDPTSESKLSEDTIAREKVNKKIVSQKQEKAMSLFMDLGTPMKAAGWVNWKLSPRAKTVNIDDVRVTMEPMQGEPGLFIHDIHSLQGVGTGAGSRAMRKIIALADKVGVPIDLTASSYRNELDRNALEQWELVKFYEKFGFTDVGESPNSDEVHMRRVPEDYMSRSAEAVDEMLSPIQKDINTKKIPETKVLAGNRKGRFIGMIRRLSEPMSTSDFQGEGWIFDDGERRVSENAHHEVADIAADNLGLPLVDDPVSDYVSQTGIIRTLFSDNHYFVDVSASPTKAQIATLLDWLASVEAAVDDADKDLEWSVGSKYSNQKMVTGRGSAALLKLISERYPK